jgi:hypothetical protein
MVRHAAVSGAALLSLALLAACDGGGETPDAGADDAAADVLPDIEPDAVIDADAADAEPDAPDADAEAAVPGWQPPAEWRRPIDDYIEAVRTTMGLALDRFDHAVKELEVFDDRLYLGYGDWTENTGRAVGLQVRCFDDPDGEVVSEFSVEEESIDYYRIIDDTLFIPGVDASEDALVGNVFFKPSGGSWTKVRSLEHNLHVIDVFGRAGALFASGGGCDDMDAYYANDDQGVIYRSDDGGLTWPIDFEWHDGVPEAVVRYEFFAGVEGNLYLFGNTINATTRTLTNVPRRWDDGAWTPVSLLPSAWIHRSYQLDPITAVVRGVDLGTGRFRAWRVMAAEAVRPLGRFDSGDQLPLDFFSVADGEMRVLTRDGSVYPDAAEPPYTYHVWATTDLFTLEELLSFTSDARVVCLALWRGAIYLGTADGAILRSTFVPE